MTETLAGRCFLTSKFRAGMIDCNVREPNQRGFLLVRQFARLHVACSATATSSISSISSISSVQALHLWQTIRPTNFKSSIKVPPDCGFFLRHLHSTVGTDCLALVWLLGMRGKKKEKDELFTRSLNQTNHQG